MRIHKQPYFTHRRLNDVLSIIVVLVALYILLLPVFPYIKLWFSGLTDKTEGYTYQTNLTEEREGQKPIPKENRLVLPGIHLDEEVHEGPDHSALQKGLWRRPHTSTPDKGGNTVIVGHRFTYNDPAVLFHLDKVKVGDTFPLYWEGKEYNYEVSAIDVVSLLAVEIENQTEEPLLTLYTCTPVWTGTERLVVKAKPIEEDS